MPSVPEVDISIVVPTFNRAGMLRHALESLVSQETADAFTFEIVVVDDGSSDGTAAVIRETVDNHPTVSWQYIYQEHAGFSAALNRGLAAARGPWLTFFDDDQLADPRWLDGLYQTALDKGVDCVDGAVALELPDNPPFYPGPRTRAFFGEKLFSKNPGPRFLKDYKGTGNLLIKRSLIIEAGGFDTNLSACEDTDLFWRLEKLGISAWFAPGALIRHIVPAVRLDGEALKRACYRRAFTFAGVVRKNAGPGILALLALQRLGILLFRDSVPYLARRLFGPKAQLIDTKIAIWWTFAFLRGSLAQLLPRIFPQKHVSRVLFSP
ncbi:MAG: glycosyltransferase family A protein [Deltaproteobacteria bacterium]|nr:glycosyltransferase family A protein [Deltaproteobacteria bacterium]